MRAFSEIGEFGNLAADASLPLDIVCRRTGSVVKKHIAACTAVDASLPVVSTKLE